MYLKLLDKYLSWTSAPDLNNSFVKYLKIVEYLTYFVATFTILYTVYLGIINIFEYIAKGPRHKHVLKILRVRIIIAHFLIMSLTFILAGHIIQFIYTSSYRSLLFLLGIILIREVFVYYLEKEIKHIADNYEEMVNLQKKFHLFQDSKDY